MIKIDTRIQIFGIALLAVVVIALPSIINGDLQEDLHTMKEGLAQIIPTPPPQNVTPPKEPGLEAMFAIAGLLAVAYLVLRQRK